MAISGVLFQPLTATSPVKSGAAGLGSVGMPVTRRFLMTTTLDIRKKRLLFRSWHRGMREADLILGSFAEANLAGFDDARLDRYEALLECPDADLFDWIAGRAVPPPEYDTDVTRLLIAFRLDPSAP
jgi:antitoxin CptB